MGGNLVFGDARLKKLHCLPMCRITYGSNNPHALVFIFIFYRAGLHHGCHTVHPVDAFIFKGLEHVDINKIDA